MPGDTGLTRVASDRTVARTPVATCARVLSPSLFCVHNKTKSAQGRSQLAIRCGWGDSPRAYS
jgi:hypothetical protein